MTNDDIDRAILASRECIGYNVSAPICHGERAIYRAGFVAGLEAAAKVCEDEAEESDGCHDYDGAGTASWCAAAIRALKDAS